ncbi:hypothetical protein MFLAVUS_010708 [Mucor flavus]|uniref:Uncharacterized protein n=1 Tax=Mucor flavus TaxID=439312 RepID=A0ABP9ZDF6_9FUNG
MFLFKLRFTCSKLSSKIVPFESGHTVYPQKYPSQYSFGIKLFKLKTLDGLKPDGTIHHENILEEILVLFDICSYHYEISYQCLPFVLSMVYEAYSSSLSFIMKEVGEDTKYFTSTLLADPMTLCRF